MILVDDLLGLDAVDSTFEWDTPNEMEIFHRACKTQPDDWYYRTARVYYTVNSHGHRCKQIKDLNFNNYVLFLGCSHTYGVGLELEKTYPYLIAKHLNCDYYNLSIGGTGVDVVEHNLITWLHKFHKKPKMIFIQWPDVSRFLSANAEYKQVRPHGSWVSDKDTQYLLSSMATTGFINARKKIISDISKIVTKNIPTLQFVYGNQDLVNEKCLSLRKLDHARDLSHGGILSNQYFAETVIRHLPENLLNT